MWRDLGKGAPDVVGDGTAMLVGQHLVDADKALLLIKKGKADRRVG